MQLCLIKLLSAEKNEFHSYYLMKLLFGKKKWLSIFLLLINTWKMYLLRFQTNG